jgi:CheY-like chemotaxis protein
MSHVLIIEDEMLIALAIQMTLEDAGATSFDIAEDEESAVEAARGHRPDVITSDVSLRSGTGPRAVEAIHREMGDMPVIFLTATPKECTSCDPPGSVPGKPFDADKLTIAYQKALAAA